LSCSGMMETLQKRAEQNYYARNKQTALVTGGLGFVGMNLCSELARRGYNVRVLDNNHMDRLLNVKKQGEWEVWYADVLDTPQIRKAAEGCDVVFHLAVVSLPETFVNTKISLETAVLGTYRAFQAAAEAGAFFVYVSSSEVYGDGDVPMSEAQCPKPTTMYGAGKAAGELVTQAYAKLHNIRSQYLIIRPFNCYGPYAREDKHATIITKMLKAILLDREVTIYGDGKQTRDFMHVEDTVDGIITAYERRDKLMLHPIVNICTGRETSLNKLWKICQEAAEAEGFKPRGKLVYSDARPGDIRRMWGNPWYAKSMLGWQYKIELKEGLRDYLRWMFENV